MKSGNCTCCNRWTKLTRHHIHKRFVWGENTDIVLLCRYCHDRVERIVSRKENEILRSYPNLGKDAMEELLRKQNDTRRNANKHGKRD